jgi:hypothetical protein
LRGVFQQPDKDCTMQVKKLILLFKKGIKNGRH